MSRAYRLSKQAKQDLDDIFSYIAQHSEESAVRVLDEFLDAFRRLAWMPGLGHVRAELKNPSLRVWPVRRYLVIYKPDKRLIRIVTVVRGERDLSSLLIDI